MQDAHESSLVVTPGGSGSFGFSLCLRAWLLLWVRRRVEDDVHLVPFVALEPIDKRRRESEERRAKKKQRSCRVEGGPGCERPKMSEKKEASADQSACMPVCRSARARSQGTRRSGRDGRCEAKVMSVAPSYHRDWASGRKKERRPERIVACDCCAYIQEEI